MKCKNCTTPIFEDSNFCHVCGAKIVTKRPNLVDIIKGFFIFFTNWDNSYIRTFRDLFTRPHVVIEAYIAGVRRRYVPPIVFLAVGAAVGMLTYNSFIDDYLEIMNQLNLAQMELINGGFDDSTNKEDILIQQQELIEDTTNFQRKFIKYFNITVFISMPFYAFISLLVFGWKKLNFAEHLIINSYLQGLSLFVGAITFVIGIYTYPNLILFQLFALMIYYLITYGKLLKLSFGKLILKFFKFLAILIGLFIAISLIAGIVAVFIGYLSGRFS